METAETPNPEHSLSPEAIERWDKDLSTIGTLQSVVSQKGLQFVVGDGYAVEAHCGGNITRPHGDIDGKVYIGSNYADNEGLAKSIETAIESETTKWGLHSNQSGKIEFREIADEKPFDQRRRLELQTIQDLANGKTQKKTLVDSTGKIHEVIVDDINLLTAIKIRIINDRLDMSDEEKTQHRRELKQQDIDEVKRLIAQPDFNQQATLKTLADTLKRRRGLSEEESVIAASSQLQRVLSLHL